MILPRLHAFVARIFLLAAVVLVSSVAAAQEKATLPSTWLDAMHWRCIGPANMGGRITALAVYEKDPNIWWAASASGGLAKTTNNGMTFEHQFDHEATVSIGDVQVAQSDPNIVWVGTGEANPRNSVSWGDGVYKSTDGGKTWKNMGLRKSFQTGRIAIHPTNPNIVYVGALGRLWGPNDERGLFKTTDGGKTWEKVLFIDDKTGIIDVQMDPKNPETLIVAAYERQRDGFDSNTPKKWCGPGSGLYRTTDGGKTFKMITNGLPSCDIGRIGISYYRADPKFVYLVLESAQTGAQPKDAAYVGLKAQDAEVGAKITEVTKDGPAAKAGLKKDDIVIAIDGLTIHSYQELLFQIRQRVAGNKIKLEVSRERKSVEIEIALENVPQPPGPQGSALRETRSGSPFAAFLGGQKENLQDQQGKNGHEHGGIYRSADGGETWTRINSVNPRPMYYSQIRVDPTDNQRIYVLGTSLWRSADGGKTFTNDGASRGGVHVDHHSMWVDPRDSRHIILGNDGGIYITHDRMENWDHHNHVVFSQFYHVTVGPRRNYRVYGGLQDNGSWGGPSRHRDGAGPVNSDWFRIGGGDGFICLVDPEDADQVYFESQGGAMGSINLRTGRRGYARPQAPKGTRYRFNWKTPFLLSSHNSKVHYSAGNHVFRSIKQGLGSKAISPEITNTDRGSGSALAESPVNEEVLYVGTTDGALWMTTDGGKTWLDRFPGHKQEKPEEPENPVDGMWTGKILAENVPEDRAGFTLTLSATSEGKVTGTWKTATNEGTFDEGTFDAKTGKLTITTDLDGTKAQTEGTIVGDKLTGTITANAGGITLKIEATREPPKPEEQEVAEESPEKEEGKKEELPKDGSLPIAKLVPGPRWVSSIEASRAKAERAYITLDGHRSNEDVPYLFVTENFGKTWKSIRANLPDSAGSARVIREDPKNADVLYLGTEFAAWVSVDRGASWTRFGKTLPTVAVHEVAIHPEAGEIVAGTHGRGIWILDATALRQMSAKTIQADAHLYQPNDVVRWHREPSRGASGTRRFVGRNPDSGANIYYSLGKDAREVSLKVTNIEGRTVSQLSASNKAGLHVARWDARPSRRGSSSGTTGTYLVTLTVDGHEYRQPLKVVGDPDYPESLMSREEYEAWEARFEEKE